MTVVKNYLGEIVGEYPNGIPSGLILGKGEYVDTTEKMNKRRDDEDCFHTGAYHIPEEWLDK